MRPSVQLFYLALSVIGVGRTASLRLSKRDSDRILTPGATLFVTNQALYPQTAGSTLQVVDADPPPKT